jgi:hypothetical protein
MTTNDRARARRMAYRCAPHAILAAQDRDGEHTVGRAKNRSDARPVLSALKSLVVHEASRV